MNRLIAVLGLAVIVQLVIASMSLRPLGVEPDLLLAAAMAVGIAGGANRGAVAGLAMGLLTDVLTGMSLGTSAIAYVLAGYLVGAVADDASDHLWVASLLCAGGALLTVAVTALLFVFTGEASPPFGRVVTIAFVYAVATLLAAPAFTKWLRPLWITSFADRR